MLYQVYQIHADVMAPVRAWASDAVQAISPRPMGIADNIAVRNLTAAYELISRIGLTHDRPAFAIDSAKVGRREAAVRERRVLITPFATLLRFEKDVERGATTRALGRTAIRSFLDLVAGHGAHHAARARRLHHRLAQRARR